LEDKRFPLKRLFGIPLFPKNTPVFQRDWFRSIDKEVKDWLAYEKNLCQETAVNVSKKSKKEAARERKVRASQVSLPLDNQGESEGFSDQEENIPEPESQKEETAPDQTAVTPKDKKMAAKSGEDKLNNLLLKVKAVDFGKLKTRAVGQLDLTKIPADKEEDLVYLAAHCCINGPVGVKRDTNWPGRDDLAGKSINGIIGISFSNSQWRGFCDSVADYLALNCKSSIEGCYTISKFSALWPKCADRFQPKARDEKGNKI